MFRRSVVALALVVASTASVSCSDHDDATSPPASTTSTTAHDGSGDGTVGGGRGNRSIDATVGAPLSFDALVRPDALGPKGDLASAFKVGSKIVVWLRLAGEDAGTETSAQFGHAEVRSVDPDGARFVVTGRVPAMLWRREQRMAPLAAVPAAPGVYEVVLQGFFAQPVVVRAVAAPPATTTTVPAPVPASSRVLGEGDLAGVALGLDEAAAVERLTQRFGTPTFDDQHAGPCGPERLVGWGSLMATFRPPAPGGGSSAAPAPRVFAHYVYSAPHAGVVEGPPDLRTASGVGPGSSLADLQAREPAVVFVTDQVGYAATTWYAAAGSRLAGRISDDVSAPDATVIEVASSAATLAEPTYPGC